MSEGRGGAGMYLRLQIAYALEFAIWGCWSYAVGSYCGNNHIAQGLLYSAFALGALFAPVFGPIADRKFPAQKVFAFMQFVCGLALLACHFLAPQTAQKAAEALASDPNAALEAPSKLWIGMMFLAGLMFMPSIPLLNAIVFKHIPNKDRSPLVFIFGTLGWIAVNLVIGAVDKEFKFFYLIDGGLALFLAFYAMTLPNTPASGGAGGDPFGLKVAGKLLNKPSFVVFILCATLVGVFGSNYYFALIGESFPNKGVLNQFSEIFFMAALAFTVSLIGLKWVLALGMAAWGARYLLFAQGDDTLALVGILLHGIAYAFLYTAAYMYGDKVAPKEDKASVQALIAFLLLGVAQVASGFAADYMKKISPAVANAPAIEAPAEDAAPDAAPEEAAAPDAAAFFSFSSVAYGQDEPLANLPSDAQEAVEGAQESVVDAVQDAANNTVDAVQDAANNAVDATQDAVANAAESVKEAATDVAEATQETVSDAAESVKETATDVAEAAQEAASNAVESVKEAATDAAEATQDAVSNAVEAVQTAAGDDTATAAGPSFLSKEFWTTMWDAKAWKAYDWKKIWGWPGYFCLFWALFFVIFGREPKSPEEDDE